MTLKEWKSDNQAYKEELQIISFFSKATSLQPHSLQQYLDFKQLLLRACKTVSS